MSTPDFPSAPDQSTEKTGFFAALFDLDFKSFVALRFIKVIYLLAIILVGVAAVVFFFVSLAANEIPVALVTLVFLFFYLILIRVWLEVIAVLFRIGENTAAIRDSLERRSQT